MAPQEEDTISRAADHQHSFINYSRPLFQQEITNPERQRSLPGTYSLQTRRDSQSSNLSTPIATSRRRPRRHSDNAIPQAQRSSALNKSELLELRQGSWNGSLWSREDTDRPQFRSCGDFTSMLEEAVSHNTSKATGRRQSIKFAPIAYTTTKERLWRKRSSLPQAPVATALLPAESTLRGPRVGDHQSGRRRTVALRPLSWTLPSSWRRSSFTVERRRFMHAPSNTRPRSLSYSNERDAVYSNFEISQAEIVNGISLEAAGIDQRDFALRYSNRMHSSTADNSKYQHRRANSWAPGMYVERRRSSRFSLPENVRSGALRSFETVFGSDRKPSILARLTEGILVPTAEEVATHFSTPAVAAFDLDLEKGPEEPDGPVNPARSLTKRELLFQRLLFGSLVLGFNAACIIASATGNSGAWVLGVILFFKSKDFLSVWVQVFCRLYFRIKRFWRPIEAPNKAAWILSLIPAYSESEEQIVKTLFSLRDNGTGEHKQVMCIVLDGKHRPIRSHMTKVVASFSRKYVSLKWKTATLQIDAGFVDDIPTLCIEKIPNAGKKDSLVLCHDLFNFPRSNMDKSVRALREELWDTVLPKLTGNDTFPGFDLVFCTDADSTIHQGALASLANACLADPNAIAACGFVFVEYEPGLEWSVWNLYQQFQYSFGQIVRRSAEHFIGKVTCLPGCITMIVVREEMAGAIEKYAKPVTSFPVLHHQVSYLGTDRRLTYSMLSQSPYLHTLFVPEAGSETVAPQSLKHYLSQRRRWGSNAYFNNYFYFAGQNMIAITRVGAAIEILRLTMVYFRVFNTVLFIKGVITHFDIIQLLPLIFISFTPSFWFAFAVMFLNRHLRENWVKLMCGFCINRCISPFMSVTVFSLVARNLGSQVWGISGVTAGAPVTAAVAMQTITEQVVAEAEAQEDEKTIL